MRITIRFQDGAIEEFDTNTLTTDSALGRKNALTDLRVILENGLWVEASWYRVVGSEGADMPLAQRSAGAGSTSCPRMRWHWSARSNSMGASNGCVSGQTSATWLGSTRRPISSTTPTSRQDPWRDGRYGCTTT